MKKFITIGLISAMFAAGASQFAFAASQVTELFGFDEIINVYDKDTGEAAGEENIPSGSKIGIDGSMATWGMNANNAAAVSASVVDDEDGAVGDAFRIHYSDKLTADSGESLRFADLEVEYEDITEEKPLVLEFRVKAEWENTSSMNAWIDVVPVIKPETGNALESNAFIQQSVQAADNGQWIDVKYVINKAEVNDDTVSLIFDRYANGVKNQSTNTAVMASGSGEGAKIIGMKIRPRARATSYNEGGYMNITFDSVRLYSEEIIIPEGTRWGDDLTVNEEYNNDLLQSGTVIGDNNTVTKYTLVNSDGDTEGYSAQIAENNSELIMRNVSSSDGYKSTLTPEAALKYTSDEIGQNSALIYEARYKIDYELNGTASYSAVQMYFDFYRNSANNTMQFAVPATTKESGEYITVKIVIPGGTFRGERQPYLFVDDSMKTMNTTIEDLEFLQLRRVVFSNKLRSGQTAGEERSAATLTLDYLDQYIINEDDAFDITADDLPYEISSDTIGLYFTGTHFMDKSTVTKAVLRMRSEDGTYSELESGTYGVKSTGDKTFYLGFGGSLVPGADYEIDLSDVTDIYGNSVEKKLYFRTADAGLSWTECSMSGDTIIYGFESSKDIEISGIVYAAVYDGYTGMLKTCAAQPATIPANDTFDSKITINNFTEGDTVSLFFWDDKNTPHIKNNIISNETSVQAGMDL